MNFMIVSMEFVTVSYAVFNLILVSVELYDRLYGTYDSQFNIFLTTGVDFMTFSMEFSKDFMNFSVSLMTVIVVPVLVSHGNQWGALNNLSCTF